jgi:hypothetical protein
VSVQIAPVRTQRERETLLRFPWKIYRGDPLWVPPFLPERRARLDPAAGPLIRAGGQIEAWLARRNGQVVGTVAGAIDRHANQHFGRQEAAFGFFECINDYAVAEALLTTVADWARGLGMTRLFGPRNFGGNNEPGLLIEGREFPPVMLMAHTPPYYPGLVERFGFEKFGDLYAYRLCAADFGDNAGGLPAKLLRVAEAMRRRSGATIRKANLSRWDQEAETARCLFNRALTHLPDHVPLSCEDGGVSSRTCVRCWTRIWFSSPRWTANRSAGPSRCPMSTRLLSTPAVDAIPGISPDCGGTAVTLK